MENKYEQRDEMWKNNNVAKILILAVWA